MAPPRAIYIAGEGNPIDLIPPPTSAQPAGIGFDHGDRFLIPERDIPANGLVDGVAQKFTAREFGEFRCIKNDPTEVFAIGDKLQFVGGVTGGVTAGEKPLFVIEPSANGDVYVYARLGIEGGAGGGGGGGEITTYNARGDVGLKTTEPTAGEHPNPENGDQAHLSYPDVIFEWWQYESNAWVLKFTGAGAGVGVGDLNFLHTDIDQRGFGNRNHISDGELWYWGGPDGPGQDSGWRQIVFESQILLFGSQDRRIIIDWDPGFQIALDYGYQLPSATGEATSLLLLDHANASGAVLQFTDADTSIPTGPRQSGIQAKDGGVTVFAAISGFSDFAEIILEEGQDGKPGSPTDRCEIKFMDTTMRDGTAVDGWVWTLTNDFDGRGNWAPLPGQRDPTFQTLVDAATIIYDCTTQLNAKLAHPSPGRTIAVPTNVASDGLEGTLIIQGGANSLTWAAGWDHVDGAAPTLPTGSGEAIIFTWIKNGSTYHITSLQKFTWV